ncbi:MAG: hypothetical protein WKG00_16580 [Polyangiaceae bacterium]
MKTVFDKTATTLALGALAIVVGGAVACGSSGDPQADRVAAPGKAQLDDGCSGGAESYIDEHGDEVICVYTEDPGDPPDPCELDPDSCWPDPDPDPCWMNPWLCNPPDPPDPCEQNPDACGGSSGGGDPPQPPEPAKCTNPRWTTMLVYWGYGYSYTEGAAGMQAATDAALQAAKDSCVATETDSTCKNACQRLTLPEPVCDWIDATWPAWDYWDCWGWSSKITDA